MSQGEVLERLYYVPELTSSELAVILNLSNQSITHSIGRLKKSKFLEGVKVKTSIRYRLTAKGVDFAERCYL